jgi:hypothetical protein
MATDHGYRRLFLLRQKNESRRLITAVATIPFPKNPGRSRRAPTLALETVPRMPRSARMTRIAYTKKRTRRIMTIIKKIEPSVKNMSDAAEGCIHILTIPRKRYYKSKNRLAAAFVV